MSGEGAKDKVSGRLKESVGALVDDDELKKDGKLEQAAGDLKDAVGRTIDRVKDAVKGEDE